MSRCNGYARSHCANPACIGSGRYAAAPPLPKSDTMVCPTCRGRCDHDDDGMGYGPCSTCGTNGRVPRPARRHGPMADIPTRSINAKTLAHRLRDMMDRPPTTPQAYEDDSWQAGYRFALGEATTEIANQAVACSTQDNQCR